MSKHLFYIVLISITLTSCDYLSSTKDGNTSNGRNIVASVGSSYLYKGDIAALISPSTSQQDSIRITDQFVKNWVKKELLVKEATDNVRIDQSEINRKVSDYRYALISYEYQRLIVQNSLDTLITNQEVASYYNQNIDNFTLRQNILRGRFLKVNKDAPKKNDIRRWLKSNRPQDLESLKSYAFQFADNYSLEDSVWLKLDDIIKNSPFSTISNKVQFLRRNRYVEETDSDYLYLLKIDEYKISKEASPLEFVQEEIKDIILNKRKVALAKSLENDIYERAKENEDYKIYR
ncbi:peptidyl-prolyl cis-trans isomerase [Roseivirga sp.]|uniref:peptidylprolyl isomerase n=1 Tax=Roseivirga sp. TaxID=1964215 RepID=UPI003B8C4D05